jgi:Flp pilus assembly protein TadG
MRRIVRKLVAVVRGSERAQTLAEFGMIAPVLFLVIFAIVDGARMMQSYVTIQAAAREGARYAVTGRTECDGLASADRYTCIVHVTEQTAGNLDVDQLTVSMRSWAFTEGGYAATATEDFPGIQCDNVEVAVSYDYDMITPVLDFFVGSLTMRASERLVNEPFGACAVPDV